MNAAAAPTASADLLIVGGGVVGLVSAYYLLQAGADVLVAGKDGPSASWAGAGILSPLPPWRYPPPLNHFVAAGAAAYPQLLGEIGDDCDYRQQGMLVLPPRNDSAFDEWRTPEAAASEFLSVREVREKIPFASPPTMDSVFLPAVAQLRPPRLLKALRRVLDNSSGGRRITATVKSLIVRNGAAGGAVLDNGETITANKVVLAAGAWSEGLCPPPAPRVTPVRGQMLLYAPPPFTLPCIMLRESDGFYLLQRPDGFLLAGGSASEGGFNDAPNTEETALLREKTQSLLPSLTDEPLRAWCGLRPKSAGGLPIISRHPKINNLFLNTAHFRYGLTMAPAAATLLMKVMNGESPQNPFAGTAERDDAY